MINDIKLASRYGLQIALDEQDFVKSLTCLFLNKMLQSGKAAERSETKRSLKG